MVQGKSSLFTEFEEFEIISSERWLKAKEGSRTEYSSTSDFEGGKYIDTAFLDIYTWRIVTGIDFK